ncbi:MAG: hypothetical protein EOP81_02445 [Variovorax sp.]|nr:MAG: hypothetical protein EOP81_02445 [Variovorax sp.]
MRRLHCGIGPTGTWACALVGALVWACAGPISAQPSSGTWRCGNTYTDQPCKGGKAVDVDDTRSAAQQQAGESQARDAGRHADALARERRALEARTVNQRPAVIARPGAPLASQPPRTDAVASRPKLHKPKKPRMGSEAFTANDPSNPPTTKNKRRQKAPAA